MDRAKFGTVAHARIDILNPVSDRSLAKMAGRLRLGTRSRVLDVGCGRGEWLVRLLEGGGGRGVGIDRSAMLIDDAWSRARARLSAGRAAFHVADARQFPLAPRSFDVAICLGATHALGGREEALRILRRVVRPTGRVVIGEGYWKRPPPPEYLHLLEATSDEFGDDASNVRAGQRAGLTLEAEHRSTPAQWDAYEGSYAAGVRRYLADHPEDGDASEMRDRIDRWEAGYRRWGRTTLGFGVYLFRAI
ncbi:MAG: class I SAM-dependent methyltransferase [Thermoplasmata archaeon]